MSVCMREAQWGMDGSDLTLCKLITFREVSEEVMSH